MANNKEKNCMTQIAQQLKQKRKRFDRRKTRTKASIVSHDNKPRLAVFRSLRFISAQIIDDVNSKTLISAYERELPQDIRKKTKTERAQALGELLAKKAVEQKIDAVSFDRSGYLYHGRVKALADGARHGGLKF